MGDENTRRRGAGIRPVEMTTGDWSSGPLLVATSRCARRRGLRPAPGPFGVVLLARSLVGWGMTEPLRWFAVAPDGAVVRTGILRPGRLVVAAGAVRWMVEVPGWIPPPPVGARTAVVPILAAWPED